MERPLSDKRPIGPFAQSSTPNGVALVYTTQNISSFPPTNQLERVLDEAYQRERENGRDEVVAADPDVEFVGSARADTRGVRVNTGVTIMNMDQFEAVKDVTTDVMRAQGGEFTQIAVAVSNP